MRHPESEAFVYVIGDKTGPQKVGYASYPKERMISIACHNSNRMVQINYLHKTTKRLSRIHERTAHCILADYCIGGEWFDVTPEHAEDAVKIGSVFAETYDIAKKEIYAAIQMTGRRSDEIARMVGISESKLAGCRGRGLQDRELPSDPIAMTMVVSVLERLGIEFVRVNYAQGLVARRSLTGGVKHD